LEKFIFIDTETTSADASKCGMWQVGGIIECGKRSEEFLLECDIFEGDEVTEDGLAVTGMSLDKLQALPDPGETFDKFIAILDKYVDRYDKKDKFFIVGYGAEFDQHVLRSWFEKNDDAFFGAWFWHPPLCMMHATAMRCITERKVITNFKLQTIAEYFGIKVKEGNNYHNALFDASVARAIFKHLTS
jgi:DNA polymerase-3 subunit epsilon